MTTPEFQNIDTSSRGAHLRDYWDVVWQGRWTVLSCFVLVVGLVAVHTYLQTPVFRATATVEVQPHARLLSPGEDLSGMGAGGYGWIQQEKYHNTQIEIIRSRDVAERAFKDLQLHLDPRFAGLEDPVRAFRGSIEVNPRIDTGLIEVSMTGSDRAKIKDWVNAVADAYVDRNLDKAKESLNAAFATVSKELEDLQEDLADAEKTRFAVLGDKGIFDPEGQEAIVQKNLSTYNQEMAAARIEVARLEGTIEKIREIQETGADPMTLPELSGSRELQLLNQQKVDLERRIQGASVTMLPGHPQYREKVSELKAVQERIDAQVALFLGNIEEQYGRAKIFLAFLADQINAAEEDSFKVEQATAEYEIAKTRSETKKRVFDLITNTMEEVALSAQMLTNNVSVLDYAQTPVAPIKPRKRTNVLLGAIFGLSLGIGIVFFLDYLDNTFRTPDDIEDHLGLSVLATVPRIQDGDLDVHAVKESYQTLRTSVIFSSTHGERRIILVTSASPQEGKSSTVAQLASVLARAGDRVLVLDCDLRRPTQHSHLKLGRETGLTNYLAAPGETPDWRDFTKKVGSNEFYAITCGPIPPNPTELFGTDRFRLLLAEARLEYDWVLIDSPPAASLADTTVLAAQVDMVVLVVRYNHADRDLTARVAQQLRNVNATIAGVVLNDVDVDRASHKDYYYAGYYYSSDESDESDEPGRRTRKTEKKVESGVGA
jgi:capsular exopolysaccharide synthesis family protein